MIEFATAEQANLVISLGGNGRRSPCVPVCRILAKVWERREIHETVLQGVEREDIGLEWIRLDGQGVK